MQAIAKGKRYYGPAVRRDDAYETEEPEFKHSSLAASVSVPTGIKDALFNSTEYVT